MRTVDENKYENLALLFDILLNSCFESVIDFAKRDSKGNEERAIKTIDSLIMKMVENLLLLADVIEPPYDRLVPEALHRLIEGRELDLRLQYPGQN